jgi:hypothetical protein
MVDNKQPFAARIAKVQAKDGESFKSRASVHCGEGKDEQLKVAKQPKT